MGTFQKEAGMISVKGFSEGRHIASRVSLDCKVRDRLCLDDERSLWEREKEKEKREE